MPNLEPLPYYKWLWRDWRSNRRVQRMSWAAKGLYRDLLDEQWAEGSIPNDIHDLADICGCPTAVMQQYWPEIEQCFDEREDGRLINAKMENQRTDLDAKRIKQSDAGRKGGNTKLLNIKAKVSNVQQTLPLVEQSPYSRAEQEHKQEHKQEQSRDTSNETVRTDASREAVERVFGFYCMKLNRNPNQYSLTPDRRTKAESRMRERIRANLGDIQKAEADLAQAVDNLAASGFHREKGYIDWIDQIFKSCEEFEKRLNWTPQTGENGNGQRSKGDATIAAVQQSIEARRNRNGFGQAGD